MANNKLTGPYDAVAQISRRQVNGLIASLHQNGASDQPPLRLGHNGVLRVGNPKPTTPELLGLRFRNWIRNFQSAGGPKNLDTNLDTNLDAFRARLAANAPPGTARMIEEEFSKLEMGRPAKQPSRQPPKKPRGRVKLQLSTPTITLADGATSEATLLTDVRAHYDPDSGAGQIAAADHPLDLIAGHITLQSDEPRDRKLTHNTLVYFPDWRADEPLEPVARAMAAMRRHKVSLVLTVVLPEDALDSRRSDLEAKLGPVSSRFAGRLIVTMDQAGGWSRAFAVDRRPSAHIVNARRQFAWNSRGDIEPAAMAAALDKHLLPALAPRAYALRPKVSGCGCGCHGAPDITFEDEKGERFALHRMRGRDVTLNFFQSWSAPCIRELQRLQALQKKKLKGGEPQGGGPYVVAFHGGNDEKAIADLRKRHGLTFPLVQDRNQAIARQYGITCWPTTIAINPDGSIGRMQLGAVRDARPATRPAKSTSA